MPWIPGLQRSEERQAQQAVRALTEETAISTERLRKEIVEAHREWVNACSFFEVACGHDEVEYAIYNLISAEKRYGMLLNLAKRPDRVWPAWREGLL
ncbi:DUF2508 domain-containing protein [Paenibacillus sp. GCM10023252]|uniref:DUF2508 domain-containing protein n=1 Tax=Paenibacillus sp. GCM10023252 TaxID=3252649 RepID=UPI00360D70F5